MRELKQLGTLDADAAAFEAKAIFSTEELKRKAAQERQRRIEAGIADAVEDMNQAEAPPFDQALVGKWLEICWSYTNKDTGEKVLVWSTGRVARVADGLTDKRSARAKKLLPAGALLWQWEADPEFEEAAGEHDPAAQEVEAADALRLALRPARTVRALRAHRSGVSGLATRADATLGTNRSKIEKNGRFGGVSL